MAKRLTTHQAKTVAPTCSCLLLCEDVVESKATNKYVLEGVIEVVRSRAYPLHFGPSVAFLRLSNVHGSQQFRVRLAGDEPRSRVLVEFLATSHPEADPSGIVTTVVSLGKFLVPKPGRYSLTVSHNGQELSSCVIYFQLARKEQVNGQQ